ncbi:MAG: hypothetical protein KDA99_06510 [Planctomycetales bacterium]|nr:hypothetical protein [Planctomycetales bacterium]
MLRMPYPNDRDRSRAYLSQSWERTWLCWAAAWALCLVGPNAFADPPPGTTLSNLGAWQSLPDIPVKLGLGGPVVGVSNGALVVAGGANFPEGPPWSEPPGKKRWHREIFALVDTNGGWRAAGQLPVNLAYAATVPWRDGFLIIGGEEDGTAVDTVYFCRFEREEYRCSVTHICNMPVAASYLSACRVAGGETIYVAAATRSGNFPCMDVKHFWRLEFDDPSEPTWTRLPPWPGAARHKAMLVALGNADGNPDVDRAVYLFGGERPCVDESGQPMLDRFEYLTDAYRYRESDEWSRMAELPVHDGGDGRYAGQRRPIAAAACVALDARRFAVFSGDTGRYVTQPLDDRPDFPTDILVYDRQLDQWQAAGRMPRGVVTTTAVWWQKKIVIPSGELRPAIRTPQVIAVMPDGGDTAQ